MSALHRCRLCLKLSRNKIHIFKDDFPKMIEILTGLKVDPSEHFPKTSCIDCAKNVKLALRTKKQIIRSHNILLEEFLAKCKENNDHSHTSPHPEVKNTDDNLIKKDNISSNLNKLKNRSFNTAQLGASTANPKNDMVSTRIITRNYSNNLPDSTVTGKKNLEDLKLKSHIQENIKQLVITETPKSEICRFSTDIEKELDKEKKYYSDDSNDEPPSPVSDTDWTPDKKEEKKINTDCVKPEKKILKTIQKASDGVFFVKKRNTLISRKKKTAETIIRIKKKPKGRTPPTRVTCEICKKEVQSYWLQKHMETHEYNPATCEFCGLISKSATALRHHVFYYHKSAADEYMCDQCGRSFRSKYRLNLHKKKEHGGSKDFECTTCGKKFFERMHLKRHVDKTHKNIRPYICDFCGKCFKSRNHIKIHERIHSKEAPYTCHMCGESFKMKLTLRTHLKGVHNVQEVQKVFCDICKRGFASDLALKAHVNSRIHETEKCQYCSEMFTRDYMVNHLRDVHGVGAEAIN